MKIYPPLNNWHFWPNTLFKVTGEISITKVLQTTTVKYQHYLYTHFITLLFVLPILEGRHILIFYPKHDNNDTQDLVNSAQH
jgi:hypothetical protein